MEILELHLLNFRNFPNKKIIFDKNLPAGRQGLTVIVGPNGSGKSNILEAIALLCAQRPLHVESDLDLVKFGKSEAKVESKVISSSFAKASEDKQSERNKLTINFLVVDELHIKKSYLVDDLKKRLVDFGQMVSIVVFHPQDLDLVAGAPTLRRHHLDSFLSSLDRDYWRNISAYNKIVVRRNKVLQRIFEGKAKPMELGFWDARLVEHGEYVSKKRREFFEFLNGSQMSDVGDRGGALEKARPLPGQNLKLRPGLSTELLSISWDLKQSLLSQEKLMHNRERDIAARVTLSGPHRDDFRFMFGGRDLAYFGSRGEQRMAVLALKLAELEYFQKVRGTRPILALDDIFSELDWEHRDAVLAVVGNQQTIITAAEIESVPKKLLKSATIISL